MKLDWERVRLLVWLRKCQTRHALERHGRHWGASWQTFAVFSFAAVALIAGFAIGWALHDSETFILLAWDGWAALVCYVWLSALAAEAQRADPIDAGRLLHLPVSLNEAFVINFAASLYNMPNVIGLAGAIGLMGGQAFHRPAAFALLPVAVWFLLAVSAWAQVLRSWFLKVFRDPRRRRWLSIAAGLILALAGQLPNLANLLNMHFSHQRLSEMEARRKGEETYDPAWASLPPGTVLDTTHLTAESTGDSPRIYLIPGKQVIYRVTYTRTNSRGADGNPIVMWEPRYWRVRDGVWRESTRPPPMWGDGAIMEERKWSDAGRGGPHTRATENLDGVPADLRDFWPVAELNRAAASRGGLARGLPASAIKWHAAVPAGWPAWIAAGSVRSYPVIPFIVAFAGLAALTGFGLHRAWAIQRAAVLMTEKGPRRGVGKAGAGAVSGWTRGMDRSGTLAKPLRFCSSSVSCLARAFLRQWARSVEIRFQIIVACGLAGGAVGFGFFIWWTERSTAGAFHVVSSIVGLTSLAFMGLFINFFGYDRSACRAMILAPVPPRDVMLAKNVAVARLVMLTTLPFVAVAAAISGEWFMSLLAWVLLAPSAVLLCLTLGNSSSVANASPIRLGQRTQGRPESGMSNGCLHVILYFVIALTLQIPQILVAASGRTWVGVLAAGVILAAARGVWQGNWKGQVKRLGARFPEVADAVGKATDM